MKLEAKIDRMVQKGNVKAIASVSLDGMFVVKGLKVMDITATAMCMQNDLPIYVFNMDIVGNLKKVISGEDIGTLVHN